MKYAHIAAYVYRTPWAILPEKLAVILDALRGQIEGAKLTQAEVQEIVGVRPEAAQPRPVTRANDLVGIVPIMGTIAHRAGMLEESSGGTSTQTISRNLRAALKDPEIGAIVLHVDSPGGTVAGLPELAAEIFAARGQKPIVALADTLAASAAYWLATAADEVMVTPSGEVGSIGVFAAHQDLSGYYEKAGIKTTLIAAGPYKTEGNPYEPLTDDARADIQASVDEFYGMFVRDVAKQRGVSEDAVRSDFGQGRVLSAPRALKVGMVDRIGTFEDAVNRAALLARKAGRNKSADAKTRAVLAGV